MRKKDLSNLKREFKLSSYIMPVKEIYSVYLKRDNSEVITRELNYFEMLDAEKKELYLNNFKKILTGAMDAKIFELDFKNIDCNKETTQGILYNALKSGEGIVSYADKIVEKVAQNFTYETDIVLNFMRVEYYKVDMKKSKDEASEEYVQVVELILCSINKADIPKKGLKLDYTDLKFKPNSALDIIINLNSPLDGFMFPTFADGYIDVNKTIYYSSKPKQINHTFVEEVLGCKAKSTSSEERDVFKAILHGAIGEKVKPRVMQEIYENIYERLEYMDSEDEDPTISMKDMEQILNSCAIENTEVLKSQFETICGGDYNFKVKNILPDFKSRSFKIENCTTSIAITPGDLGAVRHVITKDGKRCLMIELNEDVMMDGFKLEIENV